MNQASSRGYATDYAKPLLRKITQSAKRRLHLSIIEFAGDMP